MTTVRALKLSGEVAPDERGDGDNLDVGAALIGPRVTPGASDAQRLTHHSLLRTAPGLVFITVAVRAFTRLAVR
jgi:hypothetical protein